jgi:hypothetical protein
MSSNVDSYIAPETEQNEFLMELRVFEKPNRGGRSLAKQIQTLEVKREQENEAKLNKMLSAEQSNSTVRSRQPKKASQSVMANY